MGIRSGDRVLSKNFDKQFSLTCVVCFATRAYVAAISFTYLHVYVQDIGTFMYIGFCVCVQLK